MSTHESKSRIKVDLKQEREGTAQALRSLADAIEGGVVSVRYGDKRAVLVPTATTELSLKAKADEKEQSLRITLAWGPRPQPSQEQKDLSIEAYGLAESISSDEPNASAEPTALADSGALSDSFAFSDSIAHTDSSSRMRSLEPVRASTRKLVPPHLDSEPSAMPEDMDQVERLAADQWLHQELYSKAQQAEIDGRSGLSKSELIDALVVSGEGPMSWTHEEIYEKAGELEIQGRSEMTKTELLMELAAATQHGMAREMASE